MARSRRSFTREFKVQAVRLVTEQHYSFAEAARQLGITENLLRLWKKRLEAEGTEAFPGHGNRSPWRISPTSACRRVGCTSAVEDLCSRMVIGWSVATSLESRLVVDGMSMAVERRFPDEGLIAHSDRGIQYASEHYRSILSKHGIECSMSHSGN